MAEWTLHVNYPITQGFFTLTTSDPREIFSPRPSSKPGSQPVEMVVNEGIERVYVYLNSFVHREGLPLIGEICIDEVPLTAGMVYTDETPDCQRLLHPESEEYRRALAALPPKWHEDQMELLRKSKDEHNDE